MAAYNSSQTGNWSVASTWGGGGVPGDGDTAAIGAHTVTVDVATTVGDSPASLGMVVTVADSGALTVAAGITLTVKGGIQCNSAPLTLEAGAGINVVAATGINYRIQPGVSGDPLGALYCNGTANARCSITKTGLGTAEIYQYMSTSGGEFKCSYTDFSNLGGATTVYSITCRRDLQLINCTFTNCGIINGSGSTIDANKNLNVSNCTFISSAGTNVIDVRCTTAPDALKVRQFVNNSFDKALVIADMRGGVVTGNYFAVQPTFGSATYRPDTWDGNFVTVAAGAETVVTTIANDYRYNAATDNAHMIAMPDADQTVDGCVFESAVDWSTNESDGPIRATNPASSRTYTIQNNVVLPGPTKCSCTLFTAACNANAIWQVKNNTFYAGDRGRAYIGVHEIGAAGMVAYFKNNIGWSFLGDTGSMLLESDPAISIANNYVTLANYNGYINVATPYDAPGSAFAATPGANDLAEVDPVFVDSTRCLAKWAETYLGATGTAAQKQTAAINAIANMNNPASPYYVAGVTVASIVTWVKAGFKFRTASYNTASDTGSYIGAQQMATNILDVTVSGSDVATCSLTTEGVAQAAVTGTQDITNGRRRKFAIDAKEDRVRQKIDGSVDGTTDTDADVGTTFDTVRVGCSGTGLTQQPCGLISDLKIYKDVPL